MKMKRKIAEALVAKPKTTNDVLAKKFKVTSRYVQLIRRELRLPNADSRGRKAVQLPKGMETAFKEVAYQATRGRQAREADGRIETILKERGANYGDFLKQAEVAQLLKNVIMAHLIAQGKTLIVDQQEALEMIATKIARILNGNPNYADNWRDIAGYATLVADRLDGKNR